MQTADLSSAPARRRHIPLFALFTANAVSAIGDVLALIAIPWFVLQTTGSVAQTGIAAACTTGGVALSAFFGAALVDRLGFRRASVISDLTSAVAVALVPLLYLLRQLAFPELLVFVFLVGFFATPGATARSAIVPDLATYAGVRLERAAAANDGCRRIANFFGAPLAGVLIIFAGTSNLLWIDAVSFLFSAALIGLAVPRTMLKLRGAEPAVQAAVAPVEPSLAPRPGRSPVRKIGRYLSDLTQGIRFIWRDGVLFSIVVTVMVTNLLDAGSTGVLVPAYVRQVFGDPVVLGGIIAAFGGAAFLGTVIFGAIGHHLPRRWTFGVSFTIGGGPRFFALALLPAVPLLLVVYAISGLVIGPINPLISTVSYEHIPTDLRARVFGTTAAGSMLGTPLGALLAGLCATWIGVQWTLLAFGAVYLLATLSLLINPALKGMEKRAMPADGTEIHAGAPVSASS